VHEVPESLAKEAAQGEEVPARFDEFDLEVVVVSRA
jgi:hypothetical protein